VTLLTSRLSHIRSEYLSQLKNQMYSDKIGCSSARGTSFCTPTGMTTMAFPLALGRASEINIVRELAPEFELVPSWCHVCYDKGVPGRRCVLPHFNHVFMPVFLKQAKGKTKFTAHESSHNRGVARCRYVIEIVYSRVKSWHLLSETIKRENFHLVDSTWFWALGFANLCMDQLQSAPDVETAAQTERRLARKAKNELAAARRADAERVAAGMAS